MKNRWLFLLTVLGLAGFCFFLFNRRERLPHFYRSFFYPIPVLQDSYSYIPFLPVNLQNQQIKLELDLGFSGELVFSSKIIENIQQKVLLGQRTTYGISGKQYLKNIYQASKIDVGKLIFSDVKIEEESEEFLKNSCLIKSENRSQDESHARIGWKLFKSCNLFVDLLNAQIVICDSIDTLKDHGYFLKEIVQVPLQTDRGFIEAMVNGPNGNQRWVFDTGCTVNILNTFGSDSIENMVKNPNNQSDISFYVGDKRFDSIRFYRLPIELPVYVDAILGVEFFSRHQVFFDFKKNQIYIGQ